MPGWALALLAAVAGYGLGSIPFGLVLTRAAGLGDIRKVGSGNIGATNVLRTGNKALAAATLILDGGKGAAAALLGMLVSPEAAIFAGGAAVLGHLFPVWLGFRGGKGVATALGLWLALAWPVGLAACGTWLAVAALFRISSLSALVAIGLTPVYALLWATPLHAILAAAVAGAVIAKHHANIGRMLRGEEPKIGAKKKDSAYIVSD